ncbi:MAG: YaiI/YqxD family protein [Kiloniellales bacterium]|nr:YaiI/YqxD family protein [Kiloniellales bacterium]
MTEIYVDADACPVKEETLKVAARHGLKTHIVSNTWLRMAEGPLVKRVHVGEGFDAADDWIAEHIGPGDIAITADVPLAARCVKMGAVALAPDGKTFTEDSIGMAKAMRDLMTELRESGQIQSRNPAFRKEDRSRFLQALENTIQIVKRQS